MKNWKTTAIGLIGAAYFAVDAYSKNGGDLTDWKLWLPAALAAAFGYLAKDFNATGKP